MLSYSVPAGLGSFEAIEKIFRDNLPEGYTIIKAEAGGKIPGQNGFFGIGKAQVQSQLIGTIQIRQNSYNAVSISFITTDGMQEAHISVVDFVPSWIVRFLRGKVFGLLTNLIFPAIYGTSKNIYAMTDNLIMTNFKVNQYDTSLKGGVKSMLQGKGLDIKNSSVDS